MLRRGVAIGGPSVEGELPGVQTAGAGGQLAAGGGAGAAAGGIGQVDRPTRAGQRAGSPHSGGAGAEAVDFIVFSVSEASI